MRFITFSRLALLGLGLMGAVATVPATAGDVYVIANPSVSLTLTELRDAYLGGKQFAGSVKLVLVDNAVVQGEFLKKVINMETNKYTSLWTKKGFRDGLVAPATKSGDAEVISFVKNTTGAVGYISTPPPQGVSQLHKY